MKFMRFSLMAVVCASVLALTACSSVDLNKDNQYSDADVNDMINNPNGPLAKKSVYFDFDSYTVDQQNMPVVQNHGQFLSGHKNVQVRLEGNTDERGGREYNLALGQRRSEAVKSRMTLMGVNPDQIETVSFGKEKPKAYGHTEADWAENRRVDIQYHVSN
ncbi:MAG: peptidoglycan-associated lipoprotein Pal [Burkholderiales bacterium]|nr:peptidoglycan-associated lipoprotein Pal [Burkholderiales bacterium]